MTWEVVSRRHNIILLPACSMQPRRCCGRCCRSWTWRLTPARHPTNVPRTACSAGAPAASSRCHYAVHDGLCWTENQEACEFELLSERRGVCCKLNSAESMHIVIAQHLSTLRPGCCMMMRRTAPCCCQCWRLDPESACQLHCSPCTPEDSMAYCAGCCTRT